MKKLNKLVKTGIMLGLVGGLFGCNTTNRELTPGARFGTSIEDVEKQQERKIGFYVGNWLDENENKWVDEGECYFQRTFRGNDLITIVAQIPNYEGPLITRIQHSKTGIAVRVAREEITSEHNLIVYKLTAADIKNHFLGGEDTYRISWHFNYEVRQPVAQEEIKIEK